MGRVGDRTVSSSELKLPRDHFPVRQWFEGPNSAISPTIIFHIPMALD